MTPELFGENYNELVDIYSFAIVLLLDLVDAVFITHVLLLLVPNVSRARPVLRPLVAWSKPSHLPFTASGPLHTDSALDLLYCR